MKWSVVFTLVMLNVLFLVNILLISDLIYMPPLIICARVAAWAATLNFGLVALNIISPILRLVYQLFNFNIMHQAFHAIHFHRNAARSGIFFSLLHVGFLGAQYISTEFSCTTRDVKGNLLNIDLCSTQTMVTGGMRDLHPLFNHIYQTNLLNFI